MINKLTAEQGLNPSVSIRIFSSNTWHKIAQLSAISLNPSVSIRIFSS